MAFSTATITHTFLNADGTPGSGSITFSLTKRITNGIQTILPAEVTATLNSSGQLSQALTSNADAGTNPPDSQWRVAMRLQYPGSTQESYFITVPAGGGTVDLGSLLPTAEQVA